MQSRSLLVLTSALVGSLAPIPAAFAAPPTCTALAVDPTLGLARNARISQTTSDNQGLLSPSAAIVIATGTNKAYCNVHIQYSAKSGVADGYAPGESQTIGITISLPLNSVDGGTGGVQGAWNGKIENFGGGGFAGSLGSNTAATNAGFVGSQTDGGHNSSQNGSSGSFGVIQASNQLDVGKIKDFDSESQHQQYVWALAVAKSYYGQEAARNYWNGCSTGGRQGLALAEKYGDDFDGILVGAPVVYLQALDLSHLWPALINRDDVVAAGHSPITAGMWNAAISSAIAACDVQGTDVVADGVVDDPRVCKWSAANNICGAVGAPGAPNCLDSVQATALDKIFDGPRNHHGKRMWFPWNKDRLTGGNLFLGPTISGAFQATAWDHKDLNFSMENIYSTRALASANPLGKSSPIALEDEWIISDGPKGPGNLIKDDNYDAIIDNVHRSHKRGKIILWQGGSDTNVPSQSSIFFYRAMATAFGKGNEPDFEGLSFWFRYYRAPGVGHCGGGVGASPLTNLANGNSQIFDDLVKWVENGTVPQSAGDRTRKGILGTGPGSFGTRPVCPYPSTAVYNGSGSTSVASSYHCGGNLDAAPAVCHELITAYGREDQDQLDYKTIGLSHEECSPGHHRGDEDRDDAHGGHDDHGWKKG